VDAASRLRVVARLSLGFTLVFGTLFVVTDAYDIPSIGGPSRPMTRAASGPAPVPKYDGPVLGKAPATVMGLYQTVWDLAAFGTHGEGPLKSVYVQTVRNTIDHRVRLIVYMPGTHVGFNEPQGIEQNLVPLRNELKQDQIRAIQSAAADCRRNPWCGHVDEIMLVGYSQGGMDAQAMVADLPDIDAQYGWDPSAVTTVITFATPILSSGRPGVDAVYIQDRWDGVINSVSALPTAARSAEAAERRGERFRQSSGEIAKASAFLSWNPLTTINKLLNPFAGIHSDYHAYSILSHRFETTDASRFRGVKAGMVRFQGDVIGETGWSYLDLGIADAKARSAYDEYVAPNLTSADAGGGGSSW
jgi:pimeloyl-ACP methyl ester carboxylesterase